MDFFWWVLNKLDPKYFKKAINDARKSRFEKIDFEHKKATIFMQKSVYDTIQYNNPMS